MKICLIGSTRFKEKYVAANGRLTKQGHIVYTIAWNSSKDDETVEVTEAEKEILDLVHLRKILESDAVVLITDETRYVGDSTRREILWANINEKTLYIFGEDFVPSAIQGHRG